MKIFDLNNKQDDTLKEFEKNNEERTLRLTKYEKANMNTSIFIKCAFVEQSCSSFLLCFSLTHII